MSKKTDPCWEGYTQVGMKMKNGKKVPNCVPDKGVPKSKKQTKKKVSKQMCATCGCMKPKDKHGEKTLAAANKKYAKKKDDKKKEKK